MILFYSAPQDIVYEMPLNNTRKIRGRTLKVVDNSDDIVFLHVLYQMLLMETSRHVI